MRSGGEKGGALCSSTNTSVVLEGTLKVFCNLSTCLLKQVNADLDSANSFLRIFTFFLVFLGRDVGVIRIPFTEEILDLISFAEFVGISGTLNL